MVMRYERPLKRETGEKSFSVGTHAATIKKVINKQSKSGNPMFIIRLEGENEEKGVFFLTFGNDYTQDNLNYILASIEDNGVDIPDIEFGYNKATLTFLQEKEVFIKVEETTYKGNPQLSVTSFYTREEYEASEDLSEGSTGEFEEFEEF